MYSCTALPTCIVKLPPSHPEQQRLPVLFLVNGANVRAQDYTTYATLLAQRGYTFVASDYYQQLPPTFPQAPLPSICPRGQILAASAALISTFLSYANTSKALPAVQGVQQRGIVLVGHSLGGTTIMDILNRDCGPSGKPSVARSIGVDTCEGYQPMLRTASSNGSSSAAACPVPARASPSLAPLAAAGGGTVAEASSQGQPNATMSPSPPQTPLAAAAGATAGARAASGAASGAQQGVVLGAVVYEGYKSKLPPQGAPYSAYTAAGVTVPPGTFLLYMAGQYGINKTAAAYADTNTTSCACAGLAAFAGVNHYGIANWQPNGTQITPCGVKASFDPQNFTVSENVQTQQLQRMAALTDSFIRAAVFRDTKLRQGPAAGYSLQLKGQCFV